ncbi:MAG TPA: sugar transferase [Planctomycetes bacterium]|nr:sugar transferase [Planctomycetota bacterium]HIK60065.1 sugar transferase [Planctomycetota bacterium]
MSSEPELSKALLLRPFHVGGALDWDGLQPRGAYWRIGRHLLNGLLLAVSLPAVLLIALPFGFCYGLHLGGWRKVLFAQERVGQFGKPFTLYKFRTMRDSDAGAFESWKVGDSGRVTPVGAFLRRSHLDELPQIINILRGEMTFVGPRPEMFDTHRFALDHVPEFAQRLALRPGITGLAQVVAGYAGPDPAAYRAKFEQDEKYRLHFGFGPDLYVLLRTVARVLLFRGWTASVGSGSQANKECLDPSPGIEDVQIIPQRPPLQELPSHGSTRSKRPVSS